MAIKETTPAIPSASAMVLDTADRKHIKALATASAFEVKGDCPHCDGTGYSDETARKIVHSFSPAGFGADWDLDAVFAAIDKAEYVRWADNASGHDLVVENNGKPYRFQVKRPAQTEDAS